MSLSDFNPLTYLYYIWGYSWNEILSYYKQKNKEYVDKRKVDFDFMIQLAKAALGSGSGEDGYTLDTGEGIEDMTDEQEAELRLALGDDFDKLYG
jgi:hypothetical protein